MKIPAGQKISYDVTFLEMVKRPSFGWPTFDDAHTVQITEKKECSLKYFLSIYGEVGKKFEWTDQFLNGSDKVLAFLKSQKVKFFELNVDSSVAGFFMLDFREQRVCDLAYFGLIEGYIGKGLGSYMLSYAILTAWERNIKIMSVNTNTLDHVVALPLYKKFGFRVVKTESHTRILHNERICDGRFSLAD